MNSHRVAITAYHSPMQSAHRAWRAAGWAIMLTLSMSLDAATLPPVHGEAGHDCATHHTAYAFAQAGQKATPTVPTVANYAFSPNVIAATATGLIRLSARLIGPAPTRAELVSQWGVTYPLTDAGGADDAAAGDGIYSASLPVQQIIARYVASDVGRVFVGFLDVYSGSTRDARYNVFKQVLSPEMPSVTVTPLSSTAQRSTHLLNISTPTFYRTHDAETPFIPSIARAAYANLPDQFDFLNIVFDRQQIENRVHVGVSSAITGIGNPPFNDARLFGSAGRLRGINLMPSAVFFDGANTGQSHEIGHHWIAFLNNSELTSGVPHWPASTMATGTMGLSIPGSDAGGSFACQLTPEGTGLRVTRIAAATAANPVFNPLDLYLMGLIPPDEVPDQWVITDPAFAANWQTQCDGRLLTSGFKRLTIAEVIAVNGARTPDNTNAPRTFRVATVVVSDGLLSADAMRFYDYFSQRMEGRNRVATHEGLAVQPQGAPFFVATGGRAALIAKVDTAALTNNKITMVEYLNAQLNYYFISSRDTDKAILDAAPGWARTGASFSVFANPEPNTAGLARFYFDQVAPIAGSAGATRGSHFYTVIAADVAALQALNPSNAPAPRLPVNEGTDSFAYRPIGAGNAATCASGTVPVYRLFRGNVRFPNDPNHRFTTSRTVYDAFVAAGWDGEGVNFCVPEN